MEQYYSPEDMFLWDSWFALKGNECHAFHLQAPITEDPEERHNNNVSIGHAVSTDLKNWTRLPTALRPGLEDSWDNFSLWTGCVIEKDKKFYMFYTGRNKNPDVKWIQKIGIATSDDLINWEKHDKNPILEADNEVYEMRNGKNRVGKIGAWRDPYVFRDPKTDKYYMLITAREKGDTDEYNGCIGIAESDDILNWNLLPPLLAPGVYDEMEVPQMIIHNNLYYLFFSTQAGNYKPEYAKEVGSFGGRHCYYSETLFGEYKPVNGNASVYNHEDELYGLAAISKNKNVLTSIGWLNKDPSGKFVGRLSHPIELEINHDRITVR